MRKYREKQAQKISNVLRDTRGASNIKARKQIRDWAEQIFLNAAPHDRDFKFALMKASELYYALQEFDEQ